MEPANNTLNGLVLSLSLVLIKLVLGEPKGEKIIFFDAALSGNESLTNFDATTITSAKASSSLFRSNLAWLSFIPQARVGAQSGSR